MFIVDSNGNPKVFTLDPGKSATYWYWWGGSYQGPHQALPLNVYSTGPFVATAQGMWFDGGKVKYVVTIKNTGSSNGGFWVQVI